MQARLWGRLSVEVWLVLAASVLAASPQQLSNSDRRWLEQEVAALVTEEEAQLFRELHSKEERELFKELFWARRDPDLMTERNEFREEFEERVETADRYLRQRGHRGSTTPMGKLFLLLGLPDSIDTYVEGESRQTRVLMTPDVIGGRDSGWAGASGGGGNEPFAATREFGLQSGNRVEIRWVFDPRPQFGLEQRVSFEFRGEGATGYDLVLTEEIRDALRTVKASYVVNSEIAYARDVNGLLLELPPRLDPRSPAKRAMKQMMEEESASEEISFDVQAAFFRSTEGAYVPMLLEIDAEPLSWRNGVAEATFFGVVENEDGQAVRRFEESATVNRREARPAAFELPLYLSPGSYTVNLGILDDRSARVGTRRVPLYVPDFESDDLQMSSVLLYSGKRQLTGSPETLGQAFQFGGYHFDIETGRTFQPEGELGVLFFVYGFGFGEAGRPDLTGNYVLYRDGERYGEALSESLKAEHTQAVGGIEIPLEELEPGHYELEISVLDRIATRSASSRIAFVLEPKLYPLAEYSALLADYREGSFHSSARALTQVPMKSLERAVREYRRAKNSDLEFEVAAWAHTEAALLTAADESFQWRTARALLARLQDTAARRASERRWFLILAHHLYSCSVGWGAMPMLEEGLELFPDDVEIHMAVGSVYETMGARGVSGMLERAERLYRNVLKLAPGNPEARIRWGRVLQLQGRGAEALVELKRGVEQTENPTLKLVANLLMGELHDREGDLSAAILSYRAALAVDPGCQAAAVALSHALHRRGESAASRRVILEFLETGREGFKGRDHFWSYVLGSSERTDALVRAVRAGFQP